MKNEELTLYKLRDNLEAAAIYAGARKEQLCNDHRWEEACIFQLIQDQTKAAIDTLESYKQITGYSSIKKERRTTGK